MFTRSPFHKVANVHIRQPSTYQVHTHYASAPTNLCRCGSGGSYGEGEHLHRKSPVTQKQPKTIYPLLQLTTLTLTSKVANRSCLWYSCGVLRRVSLCDVTKVARSRARGDRYSGLKSGGFGRVRRAGIRANTTCELRNTDGYNSLTKIICVTKPRCALQADVGHAPASDEFNLLFFFLNYIIIANLFLYFECRSLICYVLLFFIAEEEQKRLNDVRYRIYRYFRLGLNVLGKLRDKCAHCTYCARK